MRYWDKLTNGRMIQQQFGSSLVLLDSSVRYYVVQSTPGEDPALKSGITGRDNNLYSTFQIRISKHKSQLFHYDNTNPKAT